MMKMVKKQNTKGNINGVWMILKVNFTLSIFILKIVLLMSYVHIVCFKDADSDRKYRKHRSEDKDRKKEKKKKKDKKRKVVII